jgi:hypothetical protein
MNATHESGSVLEPSKKASEETVLPREVVLDRFVWPANATYCPGAGWLGGVPLERWLQELRGVRFRLEETLGPSPGGRPGP